MKIMMIDFDVLCYYLCERKYWNQNYYGLFDLLIDKTAIFYNVKVFIGSRDTV